MPSDRKLVLVDAEALERYRSDLLRTARQTALDRAPDGGASIRATLREQHEALAPIETGLPDGWFWADGACEVGDVQSEDGVAIALRDGVLYVEDDARVGIPLNELRAVLAALEARNG